MSLSIRVTEQRMKSHYEYRPLIDTLEYDGFTWNQQQCTLEAVVQRPQSSGTCLIFLETAPFNADEILRTRLQGRYRIPQLLWTTLCQRSNGYFGCEDVYDDEQALLSHNTWFRFQIKQVSKIPSVYTWYDFTFFTASAPPKTHIILCFDIKPKFQAVIHETLASEAGTVCSDVYLVHSALVSLILELYDGSVWSLRDHVRAVETNRTGMPKPETDYPLLHEIARHVSHSSETLLVAIETVSNMHIQYTSFLRDRSAPPSSYRLQQLLDFQKQLLKGQHARSVAIEARLKNELNLAINLVAQQESAATVRISQAARSDGAAMRAVAVITLIFLPATFVSTIFSTTFFAFIPSSGNNPESWEVSERFWVYWAFAVPLTVVAVSTWVWWQQRYNPSIGHTP